MQAALIRVENPGRKGLTLSEAMEFVIRQNYELHVQMAGIEENLMATFQEAQDAVDGLSAKLDALIEKAGHSEDPKHQEAFDKIKADADAAAAKVDAAMSVPVEPAP